MPTTPATPLPPWEETPAEAARYDRAHWDSDYDTEEDDE